MKLTVFLLLSASMMVSAAGNSQVVSFSGKNVSLKKVFTAVEKQTGYVFFYDAELLRKAKDVTIDLQDVSLETFLQETLKGQRLSFNIKQQTIFITREPIENKTWPDKKTEPVAAPPPPIEVKGRILDENGEPIAATIRIKGTYVSVSSDAQGNFLIKEADENAILVITGVNNETTEWKVNGKTNLIINVKRKIKTEDALTVTAYGIVRKEKEIGYSVTKITGTEINKANSGNLLTGLIGKVSGLGITSQTSDMTPQMRILLRGIRSFGQNSNNQPLFIFNGAPLSFGNDQNAAKQAMDFINNFNPADIEDVTILKGANGTALYGPEGVNGVIIITTKKGAKGTSVINFRNNTSFQIIDYRQRKQQREFGLGSGQVDQFGNGVYDPRAGNYSWGPKYDGSMVPIGYPDENGDYQMVSYSDKKDARRFFNTAVTNRTNLSFSQGDATSSYYLGLGYVKQNGLLPGDKQDQANVLFNSSKKFGNKLNVQFNMNYSRINNDRGPDGVTGLVVNAPTFIPVTSYKNYQTDYWSNHNRYWNDISPYEQLAIERTKTTSNSLNGSLIFELKLLDWLTIREQPSLNYSGSYSKRTKGPVKFLDFARQNFLKYYDRFPELSEVTTSNTSLNNDLIISTIHKAGDFLIRTNIGNTIRQNYYKELKGGATLAVPVYNLAFSAFNSATATEEALLSRTISAFGNASLGYKDMIFLELTGRNEWDSKRAKVARGKDFYASANTSIILNEMVPAIKKLKWLSNARLRASLAKSANLNISPYQAERILGLSQNYPYTGNLNTTGSPLISYEFYADNPNPFIKPEKVISQEYGLGLGFLNNRITLDATYYYQVNKGVILNVANAYLSGYPSLDNAGKFENQGWEFDLNVDPLIKLPKGLNLSLQGRAAINTNKVLELTPIYNGLFPVSDGRGQYYARTGQRAFEFKTTDWKRDAEGRVIVDKNTGFPIPQDYGDYTIKGHTLPKYTASVGLNFSWKRFGFSIFADYLGGYDHQFPTDGLYYGTDPRTTFNNRQPFVFPNSVYDDGTGKYVPNTNILTKNAGLDLYQNYAQVSLYGLTNAANLKIRELAMQYTLPVKSNSLRELIFSVYGRDLFSFYPKSNIYGDPALIAGPGFRGTNNVVDGNPNSGSALGAASETSALPGTVLFGFTISATFK